MLGMDCKLRPFFSSAFLQQSLTDLVLILKFLFIPVTSSTFDGCQIAKFI